MNVFRILGDVSHLLAIIILLMKMWRSKSCAGMRGAGGAGRRGGSMGIREHCPLILWTFSIYLESVAILPQLFMISKTGEAESITTHYLFFLGLYRMLYLANWIWRYHTENFYDQIAVVSGVVQTIFYFDFFYLYVTKVLRGKKLSLPMPV
ncbi:hypothetical protein GDO78_009572 [Eleutherodactylus coqui]|uniref:ER lumen protein-retaining receptor n=1 Tax=Eleutherodactylus coqui TaxID=57060 RepID=A0A8J6F8Z3_ELECQ|nr:hypothetical protein GDO78_009572 [Eleutherodactylus coqui]